MRPEYRWSTGDSSENAEDRFAVVVSLGGEQAAQRHRQNVSPLRIRNPFAL
jgi:hypothetical protein